MEGIGCIPTTVPVPTYVLYLSCPAGVNVWTWGHNIQGKDVHIVQYGYPTVSPRTMRDHGGDRIGDNRGQIADLD